MRDLSVPPTISKSPDRLTVCRYSNFTVTLSGPTLVSHAQVEKSLETWTTTPMRDRVPLGTIVATVTNNGPVASDFVVLLIQVRRNCIAAVGGRFRVSFGYRTAHSQVIRCISSWDLTVSI